MSRSVAIAALLVSALALAAFVPELTVVQAQETGSDLQALRQDYANRFFELRPRMELAHGLWKDGQKFAALFLSEGATRLFGYKDADRLWLEIFRGISADPMPEPKATLLARAKANPGDVDALRGLVRWNQLKEDWETSRWATRRLIELEPAKASQHFNAHLLLEGRFLLDEFDKVFMGFAERHPDARESAVVRARAVLEEDPGKARGILLAAEKSHPGYALLQFQLAEVARKLGDLDEVEKRLVRAVELRPDCGAYQGAAAKFFMKEREDGERALPYMLDIQYLNPYHLSDHRHFTVARMLRYGLARARKRAPEGTSMDRMVNSGDVFQAILASQQMDSAWKPEYTNLAVVLISHDLNEVGSAAARVLAKNVDESFEPTLETLLESDDLRVRARSLYIAVGLRGEKAYPLVKEAFASDCQLRRYEALGALFHAGGEAGKKLVIEFREREKNEKMLEAIDADLSHWKSGR